MATNLTQSHWQASQIPADQQLAHERTTGAVEVRFWGEIPAADWAKCQVLVLQPGEGLAYLLADQSGTRPGSLATDRTESAGVWSASSSLDEGEPTWEDAAWQ